MNPGPVACGRHGINLGHNWHYYTCTCTYIVTVLACMYMKLYMWVLIQTEAEFRKEDKKVNKEIT